MKFRLCLKSIGTFVSRNPFLKLKRVAKKRAFDRNRIYRIRAFEDVLWFRQAKGEALLSESQISMDGEPQLTPLRMSDLHDDRYTNGGAQEETTPDAIHIDTESSSHITYIYQTDSNASLGDIRFASHESLLLPKKRPKFEAHIQHPWGPRLNHGTPTISNEPEPILKLDEVLACPDARIIRSTEISDLKFISGQAIGSTRNRVNSSAIYTSWLNLDVSTENLLELLDTFDSDGPAESGAGNDSSEMEELLEEMLLDCFQSLNLWELPLRAPELDSDFVSSLDLPPVPPLFPVFRSRSPDFMVFDDNSEVFVDHSPPAPPRPLPSTSNQTTGNDLCSPPPYLEISPMSPPGLMSDDGISSFFSEAPPPFLAGVNGIVDLIRMSATLLHRETQPVILKKALRPRGFMSLSAGTFTRLDKLDRLGRSWPDRDLSTMDGIQLFKLALNDGTLLCEFIRRLSPSSIGPPSYCTDAAIREANISKFVGAYESLDFSGAGNLRYKDCTFDDLSAEDLAAYARATISIYVRFGDLSASLYQPPLGFQCRQLDESITSLAVGIRNISGETSIPMAPPAPVDNCVPLAPLCGEIGLNSAGHREPQTRLSTTRTSLPSPEPRLQRAVDYHSLRLPEDECLLYKQLLSVIRDEGKYKNIPVHGKTEVQSLLDLLQHLLTFPQIVDSARRELLTVLCRLSITAGLYPRSLMLMSDPQIDKEPVAYGFFGDVLKGYIEDQCVCVKVIKLYRKTKSDRFLKSFIREIVMWGQLQHPNILPFYGVYHLQEPERICIVSPWMENGTLVEYLRACPDTNKLLLVRDIVSALQYLHNQAIVHGDLKGNNIMITLCGRACLADFGLSSVNDTEAIGFASLESTGHEGGTPRYEAPELLAETEEKLHRTTASDIYAFGCVCYEIFTGKIPFYELSSPYSVMVKVFNGETPTRPTDEACSSLGLTDEVWSFITPCWNRVPRNRPTATDLLLSPLLRNVDDLRTEDLGIWTPSKYRSALYYATNKAPQFSAGTIVTCL